MQFFNEKLQLSTENCNFHRNIAIFNEGNGKAMVEKVQRMHDDAKVQQLSTNVLG